MATKPQIRTLTGSSVDILNAIRNSASINYRDYVPVATDDANAIRGIGKVLMDFPALQNEFLNSLVNRIGLVIVKSKMYQNPWEHFKKGVLEYGEVIEEIFVDIAKVHQYDPEVAETELFKRELPNVRTAFHPMNYQKFYKVTVQRQELRKAFLSLDGVTDLVTKIIESMYSASEYDEFQVMKYLLARHLLNGRIKPITIPVADKTNVKDIVTQIKGISNGFEFMNNEYNIAGVRNFTKKQDQFIILNNRFDAIMDIEVLATAFNMDKADFMGHRVLVDSFGALDEERLNQLFEVDPTYEPITEEEKKALDEVPAIICDKDWFMIYDHLIEVTEEQNQQGLYWNYWLHLWKTFSVSPFANAVSFIPGESTVTGITVSPTTATIGVGQTVAIATDVSTTNFAPQTVTYESSDPEVAIVSASGIVTALKEGTADITVKSTFDENVTATAEIIITA